MNIIEGIFLGHNKKIALVASRFNSFIVERLIDGAIDGLVRHNVENDHIDLYKIPGAFEFPSILKRIMRSTKKYDGIICLGAVIKGETPHFDFVANEATKGIAQISMEADIPIMFGVLTTETLEQAIDRAGAKAGNKGYECALSLLEMMDLYSKI